MSELYNQVKAIQAEEARRRAQVNAPGRGSASDQQARNIPSGPPTRPQSTTDILGLVNPTQFPQLGGEFIRGDNRPPANTEFGGNQPMPLPTSFREIDVATLPIQSLLSSGEGSQTGDSESDELNMLNELKDVRGKTPEKQIIDTVKAASVGGLVHGKQTANSQKEEGMLSGLVGGVTTLLGNIDTDRLLRIMTNPALQQGSMGPEANVGQNFIRRLVEANYNVNQEDALAAQTGQTNNLAAYKAETARLKELSTTSPKLSSEIIKLYKQNESYGQSLNAIANAKTYINDAYGGVGGTAQSLLVGMGRALGVNVQMTANESIKDAGNRVKAAIIGSGMFGRETSSKELKLLDKLVLQISTLTSKDQVLNSFEQLTKTFQGNMQLNASLIKEAGFKSPSEMAGENLSTGLISKRELYSGGS